MKEGKGKKKRREGGRQEDERKGERERAWQGERKEGKERKSKGGKERKKETVKKIKPEMVKLQMLRVPSICHTYFFPALYPFWVDILILKCWHLTVVPLTWFATKM